MMIGDFEYGVPFRVKKRAPGEVRAIAAQRCGVPLPPRMNI